MHEPRHVPVFQSMLWRYSTWLQTFSRLANGSVERRSVNSLVSELSSKIDKHSQSVSQSVTHSVNQLVSQPIGQQDNQPDRQLQQTCRASLFGPSQMGARRPEQPESSHLPTRQNSVPKKCTIPRRENFGCEWCNIL